LEQFNFENGKMENEPVSKTLLINNQIEELIVVQEFVEELGEEWELSMPLILSLNLVLEEALTNIILYGFDDNDQHKIEISIGLKDNEIGIVVVDDGHPYDPTLKEDPDITVSAEERKVGGLGIFLIKKIMDKVEYQRRENKNHLILAKNITL
jgi:serine/threonine-protein kinase RsbW